MQFLGNFAKSYVGAPPGELAPPRRENPGSATDIRCRKSSLYTFNTSTYSRFSLTPNTRVVRSYDQGHEGEETIFFFNYFVSVSVVVVHYEFAVMQKVHDNINQC